MYGGKPSEERIKKRPIKVARRTMERKVTYELSLTPRRPRENASEIAEKPLANDLSFAVKKPTTANSLLQNLVHPTQEFNFDSSSSSSPVSTVPANDGGERHFLKVKPSVAISACHISYLFNTFLLLCFSRLWKERKEASKQRGSG